MNHGGFWLYTCHYCLWYMERNKTTLLMDSYSFITWAAARFSSFSVWKLSLTLCLSFCLLFASGCVQLWLYLCIVWALQTGYKSMLFWIRAECYRNKQAKTFGSQVAESAVCASLQTPSLTWSQVTVQWSWGKTTQPVYKHNTAQHLYIV